MGQRPSSEACCCSMETRFLQTQFRDASPPIGPVDSWTLHGLWYLSPSLDALYYSIISRVAFLYLGGLACADVVRMRRHVRSISAPLQHDTQILQALCA